MQQLSFQLDESLKTLPRIKPGKNVIVAFLLALLLGAFGTGIYLRSWLDGLAWAVLLIGFAFLFPQVSPILSWIACGAWAALRVHHANRANRPPPLVATSCDTAEQAALLIQERRDVPVLSR